jgi:hypothetical protein
VMVSVRRGQTVERPGIRSLIPLSVSTSPSPRTPDSRRERR